MQEFQPDWIVAMGGGSPIDAAKAMWAFYEYPDVTFEDLCIPFNFPELRTKAKFAAIPSTSCFLLAVQHGLLEHETLLNSDLAKIRESCI